MFIWLQDFLSSNSVGNHTRDKQIGQPRSGSPICLSRVFIMSLLVTRMITD